MTTQAGVRWGGGSTGRTLAAELLRPWRWYLVLALACVAGASALDLVPPLVIGNLVDRLRAGVQENLLWLGLAYLGALVAMELLRTAITVLTATVAQGALRTLRVRLYGHLQRLPTAYHDVTPLGDSISRCTADLETINALFSLGIVNLLSRVVLLVSTTVAMLVLSPALSLVLLVVLPPVLLITRAYQRRIQGAERGVRRGISRMNARLQEALAGAETLRALDRAGGMVATFRRTLLEALAPTLQSVWYGTLYSPALEVLAASTAGVLFVLGGLYGGRPGPLAGVSAGTVTSFVLLLNLFFEPLIALGEDWGSAQAALAGLERVREVLRLPVEASPAASAGAPPCLAHPEAGQDLVRVQGLSFGYLPGEPVLSGIDLSVPAGRHLAIVGRTGAGKSSLLALLGGLYAPWEGTIRIAGCDPRQASDAQRRRLLAPVPQTVQLFGGTVRDNLTLGAPEVTEEALGEALRVAGAEELVRSLPLGLDTPLSDVGGGAGAQLSTGQRQLLTLARALVAHPLVLLLDEATASVDSETEASLRQAMRVHMGERGGAVLTIAHRLATALEADEVVVLSQGRIVEQGPPAELLARGGMLHHLWELERSGWA
ncbi:MAG: ABC transporter ATP-binding protein [Anaerolineae bacterium]|jgi:ATP-binding cassette subfamily B multidrug efflux pump|nr:ABC transporter ATP-binding protein [Chloroflexota bacterium]